MTLENTRSLMPRIADGRATPGRRRRLVALAATGGATSTLFGAVAYASARRKTVGPDVELHAAMQERLEGPVADAAEAAAEAIDPAGKWWVYAPVALAAAGAALTAGRSPRSRVAAALSLAAVPAVVTAITPALDDWLPQPPVGPRRRPVDHPVFPSGHAFRATAVAASAAYVLTRESVVHAGIAWPVALAASFAVGAARLVREKHLVSDVIGAWLGGAAVAAAVMSVYELTRSAERD